jgi:hypothetical protein
MGQNRVDLEPSTYDMIWFSKIKSGSPLSLALVERWLVDGIPTVYLHLLSNKFVRSFAVREYSHRNGKDNNRIIR